MLQSHLLRGGAGVACDPVDRDTPRNFTTLLIGTLPVTLNEKYRVVDVDGSCPVCTRNRNKRGGSGELTWVMTIINLAASPLARRPGLHGNDRRLRVLLRELNFVPAR